MSSTEVDTAPTTLECIRLNFYPELSHRSSTVQRTFYPLIFLWFGLAANKLD